MSSPDSPVPRYNFIRSHKTLRMPPALAAGITKTVMSWDDIVAMMDAAEIPQKCGLIRRLWPKMSEIALRAIRKLGGAVLLALAAVILAQPADLNKSIVIGSLVFIGVLCLVSEGRRNENSN